MPKLKARAKIPNTAFDHNFEEKHRNQSMAAK